MKMRIGRGVVIMSSVLALGGMTGCAGDATHRSTGTMMNDSTLTTKIKADMYADPVVKGHEISVNTYRGVVQLNGFVDSETQKERAEEIVHRFPQVVSVQNNLAVKPEPAGAELKRTPTPAPTPKPTIPAPEGQENNY